MTIFAGFNQLVLHSQILHPSSRLFSTVRLPHQESLDRPSIRIVSPIFP